MGKLSLSVVIATYNRAHLVGRAIRSCLDQDYRPIEVIVVDDSSTDNTAEVVQSFGPDVRYFRQSQNQGPSVARNRGIREAKGDWVVILDDDDALQPGALRLIADRLVNLEGKYPVVKFACSNGRIPEDFRVLSLKDYVTGELEGDFTPVINRARFLDAGLAYPGLWVGAEHLLWWHVARSWGIPAWNVQVTKVGTEASNRLTSWGQHKILRARDYAMMQEMTLETFPELERLFPSYALRKHYAAVVYWLLSGERKRALAHVRYFGKTPGRLLGLLGLLALPTGLVRSVFRLWAAKKNTRRVAKNIILLVTGLGRGGAETQVVSLAKALKRREWKVQVVAIVPVQALVDELMEDGIGVAVLGIRSPLQGFAGVVRFARLLHRERPAVLHAHMIHANVLARVVRLLAPVPVLVCTAHNVDEKGRRRSGRWREFLYRVTDPLCDVSTQVSVDGLERYIRVRAFRRSKARYIPNGIDTRRFRPDPKEREKLRAELDVGDSFVWIAVGRFEHQKDYPNMLKAFALATRARSDARLLIAGDGPLRRAMEQLAGELGIDTVVRFLGVRRDVPSLLNAADAYVMSSIYEGLPMVLLEAHAVGLPVIATNVGGNKEIVLDDRSGFLVPPRDSQALAQAMTRLMNMSPEGRRRMGEAGRKHVEEKFSLEKVVEQWESLYSEFLARRGVSLS